MESVLTQLQQVHYVSESAMVDFVSRNAPMEWDDACDYVRNNRLTSPDGNRIYWTKEDINNPVVEKYNTAIQIKWIRAFFDAHPWIERMMVVFDD